VNVGAREASWRAPALWHFGVRWHDIAFLDATYRVELKRGHVRALQIRNRQLAVGRLCAGRSAPAMRWAERSATHHAAKVANPKWKGERTRPRVPFPAPRWKHCARRMGSTRRQTRQPRAAVLPIPAIGKSAHEGYARAGARQPCDRLSAARHITQPGSQIRNGNGASQLLEALFGVDDAGNWGLNS
jgi:hypothetical protein